MTAALDIWSASQPARPAPRALEAWRIVEGQHVISTRRLVDSLEDQALLEELIDGAKPPAPSPALARLHFLLSTPFRYPPLRHGSRFGTPFERSLFYASLERQTALAERAYYRLLFLDGTAATLRVTAPETAFTASIAATKFIDLTSPPYSAHEAAISSPSSYAVSQPLGQSMRAAGIDAFTFTSARAPARGTNLALFQPAFSSTMPQKLETWNLNATRDLVEFTHITHAAVAFPRMVFEVRKKLPHPGV